MNVTPRCALGFRPGSRVGTGLPTDRRCSSQPQCPFLSSNALFSAPTTLNAFIPFSDHLCSRQMAHWKGFNAAVAASVFVSQHSAHPPQAAGQPIDMLMGRAPARELDRQTLRRHPFAAAGGIGRMPDGSTERRARPRGALIRLTQSHRSHFARRRALLAMDYSRRTARVWPYAWYADRASLLGRLPF